MKKFLAVTIIVAMLFSAGCVNRDVNDGPNGGPLSSEGSDAAPEIPAGASENKTGLDINGDKSTGNDVIGTETAEGAEAVEGTETDGGADSAEGTDKAGSPETMEGSGVKIDPIVAEGFLLGGTADGVWIEAEDLIDYIKGGETYNCYAFDKKAGTGTGGSIELLEPCDTISVSVSCENDYLVASSGEWNALPRIPDSQGTGSETYKKIVSDVLADYGLVDAKVIIKQNYRIDLEGDGVDEVLIWASNIDFEDPGIRAEKGKYSIILLRKVVDGEVKNIPVTYAIYNEDYNEDYSEDYNENTNYAITYVDKIRAIADLNGDGTMEIIVDSRYYEGQFVVVFELQGDKPVEVLSNGWGV